MKKVNTKKLGLLIALASVVSAFGIFTSINNTTQEKIDTKAPIAHDTLVSLGRGWSPIGSWAFQDVDGFWYDEPGGNIIC